jgi:murein DD-endopeptidase MepM/ murein hydrolase activator NlpD
VPPVFPDSSVLGTPVLVAARGPDTALWVGTYGRGLFEARQRARAWQQFPAGADTSGPSSNIIDAIGFTRRGAVWYGTVGNGFGRSLDGGKTWRNWTQAQLGPEWQYVAPDGIRGRGDTIFIATADGLRLSGDNGATWRCIRATSVTPAAGATSDGCSETIASLPNSYLLALELAPDGALYAGHLHGLSVSRDHGRTWTAAAGVPAARVRAVRVATDSSIWVATETGYFRAPNLKGVFKETKVNVPGYGPPPGAPRGFVRNPISAAPAIVSSRGLLVPEAGDSTYHLYIGSGDIFHPAADLWAGMWDPGRLLPTTGSDVGFAPPLPIQSHPWDLVDALPGSAPADPKHPWLQRPTGMEANPYVDQTYRYGATFDGTLQQHQGIEFNEPSGTPVHAIADGTVIWAGPGEAGAQAVALRHDERAGGQYVFSVYYHNSRIDVQPGQHVSAGEVLALVGHTGRATNNHLHLEVHVAPTGDSSKIVSTTERFLPYTVNPQLWIAPLPGTGVVAGRVLDTAGKPVAGARVYGLVLPYPSETPLTFAETYRDKAHADPAYDENFAVGDVPPGRYLIAALVDGKPIWRTLDVAPGKVSWVEFRPAAATP